MPQWTGWCNAPDTVEGVAVQTGNGGWYYNVVSQVHDLGQIEVTGNHITLVGARANTAHITWELVALDEDGTRYTSDPYDAKLYHWYTIDPNTGSHSVSDRNNEYGSNFQSLIAKYSGLPDDIVDADNELRRYSDELMSGLAEALRAANPAS
jgi:hypothetical protein